MRVSVIDPRELPSSRIVAVCNFALLGKASVEAVFAAMSKLLAPRGAFIVQTLHPWRACGETPYRDGWREGSWAELGEDFTEPAAPWYFRTLESWTQLIHDSGLRLLQLIEPLHPASGRPASVVFVAVRESYVAKSSSP